MNRNTCPRCRYFMRAFALDAVREKDPDIKQVFLCGAKAYRDFCSHNPSPSPAPDYRGTVFEPLSATHSRAVADLYND